MRKLAGWQLTAVSVLVSAAIIATSLVFSQEASADPVIAEASMTWEDGYNHFIVAPSHVRDETSTHTRANSAPTTGFVPVHTPDGRPMALLPNGQIIDVPEAEAPALDQAAPMAGGFESRQASEAFARQLKDKTGIVSATPMYGGLVAVATTLDASGLEQIDGVGKVDQDILMQLGSLQDGTPNDPGYGTQWMHQNTGSPSQAGGYGGQRDADASTPDAWPITTGAGIVVADIDSGVQTDHPDLSARIWRNSGEICDDGIDNDRNGYVDDCNGWDFGDSDKDPNPTGSGGFGAHGTHVAGIIAATADNSTGLVGMAPHATVMPIKAATGNNLSTSALITGIFYAVDNGAKVINASWGTPPGAYTRQQVTYMEQAIAYAQSKGVVFVAAAGNDNVNTDQRLSWPSSYSRYYDNVVTVGASTNTDGRASFSNYGSETVDIFAPGWFINSTVPGSSYAMMSGTSMAAPCVAGAVALMLSSSGSKSPAEVRTKLKDSSDKLQAFSGISKSSGRLNAGKAIDEPLVTVALDGLDSVRPDATFTATARLTAARPSVVSSLQRVQLHVATLEGGSIYSVSGLPIDVGGQTVVTDDQGAVTLTDNATWSGTSSNIRFETALPAGEYSFVTSVANTNGPPQNAAVYFSVADAPQSGGGGNGSGPGSGSGGSVGGPTPPPGTPNAPSPGDPGSPNPGTRGSPGGQTGSPGSPAPGQPSPSQPGNPGSGGSTGGNSGSSGGNTGSTPKPGVPAPSPTPGLPGGGTPPPSGGNPGSGGATPAPQPSPTQPSPVGGPGGSGGGSGGSTQPTPPSDPAPVESNGWRLELIRPRSGATSGGTLVTMWGYFPDPLAASVFFGQQRARIVYASENNIFVWTPIAPAGVVDVTVSAPGVSMTLAGVYTYVSPDSGGNPGGGSSGGSGGSAGGGGSGGSSPNNPGSGSGPGTPTGGGGGGSATPPPTTETAPIKRGGLTLNRPVAGSAIAGLSTSAWLAQICRSPTCNARILK